MPLLDQDLAMPGQVTELPNLDRGHEAAPQQSVLQQLRDPDAIQDVRLPSRDLFDVSGVDQQARAGVLEDVEHGLPVHPRALHRHVGDPVRPQPVAQPQQLRGRRAERADVLLSPAPRARHPHARGHRVPMHIQPTSPLDLSFHRAPPGIRFAAARRSLPLHESARRAPTTATMRGAESSHVKLAADAPVPERRDVARTAAGAMVAHFHAAWVGPRPMLTS